MSHLNFGAKIEKRNFDMKIIVAHFICNVVNS